jgi:hypothetical protein
LALYLLGCQMATNRLGNASWCDEPPTPVHEQRRQIDAASGDESQMTFAPGRCSRRRWVAVAAIPCDQSLPAQTLPRQILYVDTPTMLGVISYLSSSLETSDPDFLGLLPS